MTGKLVWVEREREGFQSWRHLDKELKDSKLRVGCRGKDNYWRQRKECM